MAEDPIAPAEAKRLAKANTDSGYHGLSEDDMDVDRIPPAVQLSMRTNDTVEISPASHVAVQPTSTSQIDERSTTETSFHSAKEEMTKRDVITSALQEEASSRADEGPSPTSSKNKPPSSLELGTQHATEDAMDLDMVEKEFNEDLAIDESRSPSQGSSPARQIVRKSSLTFAALPAREPLTTKKSLGANRGSFLGRLTGGKSMGGLKQSESAHEKEIDDDIGIDAERPTLTREESDGDSKMAKLHNKSSTQRLHERINLLGKSQNSRPTKSIPPSAAAMNSIYPQLPNPEPQPQAQSSYQASVPSKTATMSGIADEDDDDWIQPPQPQSSGSNRPQLSKSISADVMENVRGKQTIGGHQLGVDRNEKPTKRVSPLRQGYASQPHGFEAIRAASDTEPGSPWRPYEYAGVNSSNTVVTEQSTTPTGSPSSKRYVDGPLSASKSKLQSIMKTARGLFSSSAGVSAQAKMETLSTSLRLQDEFQEPSGRSMIEKTVLGGGAPRSPVINPAGRKTRSSTEKEERRKQSEAKERERAEAEAERAREQHEQEVNTQEQIQTKDAAANSAPLPTKPTRQSPRKTQNQEGNKHSIEHAEDEAPSKSMGPPQQSSSQRPKDPRRPIRPAKEAGPKPKPQPVAIRVGTLSQGMRLNNAALSSNLQESLPTSQPKQPAVAKKPSNASIQSTASNTSFKSSMTSASSKPKALIAAERKKEQVSDARLL